MTKIGFAIHPLVPMASVVPLPPDIENLPCEVLPIDSNPLIDLQELQTCIKRAGQALLTVVDSTSFSSECRSALATMAASGHALELHFVQEISTSKLCTSVSRQCTITHLIELRDAMADCVTVTKFSPPLVELLSLWSVVHASVTDAITQVTLLLAPIVNNGANQLPSLANGGEHAKAIGKRLLAASSLLPSSTGHELRKALHDLAETGQPIADHVLLNFHQQIHRFRELLSDHDWTHFRSFCLPLSSRCQAIEATGDRMLEHAKEATEKVTSTDFFASPSTKLMVASSFADLDGVFGQSRILVDEAFDTIRTGGATTLGVLAMCLKRSGLPPLLRVEIVRDFFQTVSLFFAGLYVAVFALFEPYHVASEITTFLSGLRSVYDVMAFNVVALIATASQSQAFVADVAVWSLLTVMALVYLSYLWFACSGRHWHRRADEVRQGHEAVTWALLAKQQAKRVRGFTVILTACLTAYLPVTRLCLDIVLAATNKPTSVNEGSRASTLVLARLRPHPAWPVLVVIAIVILLTFTLPLPWFLVRAIRENCPTGSLDNPLITYDLDGEMVPFDDQVYARLVTRDPSQLSCPYRSLYAGFEQRWRYYKVLQLVIKLVLALGITLTTTWDAQVRGILSCTIYTAVVLISGYGTPFSDPLNNVMEISGKVTALSTCVGGASATFGDADAKRLALVTVLVSVVHLINLLVMLLVVLSGLKGSRLFIKNLFGWITFGDPSRGLDDASAKHILPKWDIEKQVKHRVWQAFWRSVLLQVPPSTTEHVDQGTVVHRFAALEQAVVASGIHRVRLHWRGEDDKYTRKLRQTARWALEGVDVYWNEATGTRDGTLDSKSCFGKMYVVPYPFHCIVVYDDAADEAIIRDETDHAGHSPFATFLTLNFSPQILAKRSLRQKLRVLSARATLLTLPFTRQEHVTVEDGTLTRTDAEGRSHTETRYSTVPMTCAYTCGTLHVATKGDETKRLMAEGFDVTMTYRDGHGTVVAPHTKRVHELHNRVAIMGMAHLGLTFHMDESEPLARLFDQSRAIWGPGVIELNQSYHVYRQTLVRKHCAANATLSDAFWYVVYNNPHLSRDQLQYHWHHRETNPELLALVETFESKIDALYARLAFIYSDPATTVWFVFWDDVFARNGDMTRFRALQADFDPNQATAICYHVMRRPDLETWLRQRQLMGTRRFFSPHLLDLLYHEVDKRLGKEPTA